VATSDDLISWTPLVSEDAPTYRGRPEQDASGNKVSFMCQRILKLGERERESACVCYNLIEKISNSNEGKESFGRVWTKKRKIRLRTGGTWPSSSENQRRDCLHL
jgi:hypothetical protein